MSVLGSDPFRIFVGWDSREPEAYAVCAHSLKRHASVPVEIIPIKQSDLRAQGLYTRDGDPLASTEFTYTRFFTPLLAGYQGHALFCDCDFLWTGDIAELLALTDSSKAVACVQHDHRPPETLKMDDAVQTRYPRKNWSSLMLFNAAHPSAQGLSADVINRESGAYLHRMQWAADEEIGALPETWNWLEGWSQLSEGQVPKAIHFTRGGPWFSKWQDVAFADLWRAEWELAKAAGLDGA